MQRWNWVLILLCVGGPVWGEAPASVSKPTPTPDVVQREVLPFLKKHCLICHDATKKKGDVDLSKFVNEQSVLQGRKTWENALRMLRAGEMPPEDHPQPTEQEKEQFAKSVTQVLNAVDCSKDVDPGHITIRRLNRVEYNNTIRDLTGVDLKPADDFPADDMGYGFDHIGDVLSLPPVLFEKYLAAAEKIMDAALREGEIVNGPIRRYLSREMQSLHQLPAPERGKYGRAIAPGVELQATLETAAGYDYIANVRALVIPASKTPKRLALKLDGHVVRVLDYQETKTKTYPVRLHIPAGKHTVGVAWAGSPQPDQGAGNPKPKETLVFEYIDMQGPIDTSPTLSEQLILTGNRESSETEQARVSLQQFSERAFRRPVTPEELAPFLRLYQQRRTEGDSFVPALKVSLVGILISPHFLFRLESDAKQPATLKTRPVNDFELATRLSYFLWSTMPDDELFTLARAGRLRHPDVLRSQLKRMLQDPKRSALVENFTGQWLQLRNLSQIAPDKTVYPQFDDALRTGMRRETELFFEHLIHTDRSILELLDCNYSFLNERLAKHYGISGVHGETFQKVSFTNDERGGILAQGSILTVTSNPTRTSPVKRGKWVLENLLGAAPPPPPPMVKELDESPSSSSKGSMRQRMEQHRNNPSCASCHQRMDPLGFGLENFDGIGQWRTADGKFPIDPAGELPSGESFKTPKELRGILLQHRAEFVRCLAEKMLTYALGRGVEFYDSCALDRIIDEAGKQNYRLSAVVESIVFSDPFLRKRIIRGEP